MTRLAWRKKLALMIGIIGMPAIAAPPVYTVTEIRVPSLVAFGCNDALGSGTSMRRINDAGQAVGSYWCYTPADATTPYTISGTPILPWQQTFFAIRWSEATGPSLISASPRNTLGRDINEFGEMLVWPNFSDANYGLMGAEVYGWQNGLSRSILVPQGCYWVAKAINDSGSVLVHSYFSLDTCGRSHISKVDGTAVSLPLTSVNDMNNSEAVVGSAKRWSQTDGVAVSYGSWWQVDSSGNSIGTIQYYDSVTGATSGHDAAIWGYDKTVKKLPKLPGFFGSVGWGMNDQGGYVGYSVTTADITTDEDSATAWFDGVVYDLNELLVDGSRIRLTATMDINNAGWITAWGYDIDEDMVPSPAWVDATLCPPEAVDPNSGTCYDPNVMARRYRAYVLKPTAAPSDIAVKPMITGMLGNNGYYVGDVSVNWEIDSVSSTLSQSAGCRPRVISIDTQGHGVNCVVTDGAQKASTSAIIRRDTVSPSVSASLEGTASTGGWHNSAVSVAFTGTDATSGIAACSSPVIVATEGADQTSPSGTCTDLAGNVSAPATYFPISIDLTPPTVSAKSTPTANAAGWNNSAVTVSYVAVDPLSGVATDGCSAPITLNVSGSGQSATGSCTDRAGNSSSATVSGINIDLTPPTATAIVSPAANAANWHRTPVTVSFAGTDSLSGSGVASCSANVVVGTDSAGQTRSGNCTDLAENISSLASATVNLDQASPTISITAPVAGASYLQNSANSANYNCSDATSGIAACLGTVPSGTAFSTSNLGANTFTVQALDVAGNSASRTVSYTVTAPSPFTISATSLAFGDRLQNTSTALAVTIRNTSTAALALTAPTLSGTNANQFTLARTCGTSLAANASCTVTATFRPTTAGAKTAAFSIRIGTSTQTVSLSGTGVAVAFTVSPTSIPFPNQTRNTTSPAQVVTVANQTALPITLSTIALSGTNANQFILTRNCGTTLAANSSCTVNVAFRPTSAGAKRATLTVTPSGATAKTVALTGTGL